MKLAPLGYALDVALAGASVYLLACHPLVQDMRRVGPVAALAALPFGGPTAHLHSSANASAPFVYFADPTANAWADYIVGDNLGAYGGSSPDTARFHATDAWLNSLLLPPAVVAALPHMAAIWARNLLAGWALYFGVGVAWAVWIYWVRGAHFFPQEEDKPSWDSMFVQMRVSTAAMVMYSFMPTLGEWLMERGLTRSYMDVPAGWEGAAYYALGLSAYLLLVEWGVYWCHRTLHDIHPLYLLLHKPHHIYNNKNALSPFAGLAFHPVDGMIQVSRWEKWRILRDA